MTVRIFSGLLLLVSAISACKHTPNAPEPDGNVKSTDTTTTGGKSNPCSPDSVYFEKQILPVLRSNCAMSGCHDAASRQDGVILDSYESVLRTGDVRPGNPSGSDLYEVLNETGDKRMPPEPAAPLTNEQNELIRKWISQGAKDLHCDGCDTSQFTFGKVIFPIIQSQCQGCHNVNNSSGEYKFTNYEDVKTVALNGKLYGTVAHLPSYSPMPQGGKLQDCQIVQIRKWIDEGAPNN